MKVNGKDDIPYMKWTIKAMSDTTNHPILGMWLKQSSTIPKITISGILTPKMTWLGGLTHYYPIIIPWNSPMLSNCFTIWYFNHQKSPWTPPDNPRFTIIKHHCTHKKDQPFPVTHLAPRARCPSNVPRKLSATSKPRRAAACVTTMAASTRSHATAAWPLPAAVGSLFGAVEVKHPKNGDFLMGKSWGNMLN